VAGAGAAAATGRRRREIWLPPPGRLRELHRRRAARTLSGDVSGGGGRGVVGRAEGGVVGRMGVVASADGIAHAAVFICKEETAPVVLIL
jgi:hypothetical protein